MRQGKGHQSRRFCIEVSGKLAMFATPLSKENCEKISYAVPTYSALQGMLNRIYCRRGIIWMPTRVRVMNKIAYDNRFIMTPCYTMERKKYKTQRFRYSYLTDVRYQIEAYYSIDYRCLGMKDAHLGHDSRIMKSINAGCSAIWLGTSDCFGIYRPCIWGEGEGYYDNSGLAFEGHMFHDFHYSRRIDGKIIGTRSCHAKMIDGIVEFEGMFLSEYREWR